MPARRHHAGQGRWSRPPVTDDPERRVRARAILAT